MKFRRASSIPPTIDPDSLSIDREKSPSSRWKTIIIRKREREVLRRFAGNPDRKNERNFDLQCVLSYKRGSWCKGHGREMNTEGERRNRTRERKGKLIDYEVSCDNTAAQSCR
jgi:hypothetical protein